MFYVRIFQHKIEVASCPPTLPSQPTNRIQGCHCQWTLSNPERARKWSCSERRRLTWAFAALCNHWQPCQACLGCLQSWNEFSRKRQLALTKMTARILERRWLDPMTSIKGWSIMIKNSCQISNLSQSKDFSMKHDVEWNANCSEWSIKHIHLKRYHE